MVIYEIKSAEFIKSSTNISQIPNDGKKEIAFIGRSNVGKSSLINMLCNRKDLAKTSSTPGKTQLINHFLINQSWYLVDLPGYGFAKVGHSTKKKLTNIIEEYLFKYHQVHCTFVLIDIRHEPKPIDLNFINKLGAAGIPLALVFTKADKVSQSEKQNHVSQFKAALSEFWEELPPVFITSSVDKSGREALLNYIQSIL